MIDIHCHILPNVDDGPSDMQISLKMAECAAAEGITTAVATPHCIPEIYFNKSSAVESAVDQLQENIDREGIPLTILPGMEVHLTLELPKHLSEGTVLTIGDLGHYLLLELPTSTVPAYAEQIIFQIMLKGIKPIIAHPERNRGIMQNPAILHNLIEKGCLVQVTADSITGKFGSKIQTFTKQMIELGWVDFVATDGHHPTLRPMRLIEAVHELAALKGKNYADQLLHHNPKKVINDELINKDEVLPWQYRKRKKRTFFDIFIGAIFGGKRENVKENLQIVSKTHKGNI